ncbi:ankyrin repeat and KH domain-containing protein R11A8.7-like [Cimex lectularius]|uniref:SAM domain-containing protein n=1 Tax=Cimex lectularius TaxID=79782 RepID=A0A8I6TF71_CIMLE|nr:ankyrin repeat and KH domain-containing protein R11A8.7-like [Cimex lectularius]
MEDPVDILKNDIYDLIFQIETGILSIDDLEVLDELGKTLYVSVELGLYDVCEKLIKFNCEIDSVDENGRTPLMSACHNGNVRIADLLLKNGSNPEHKDEFGNTPLLLAIENGHIELVEILLKNVKSAYSETLLGLTTPLAVASFCGENEIVEILLQRYPNTLDLPVEKSGMTPLMLAISAGHVETTKLLLKRGASTEVKNSNFQTPYDIACGLNMAEMKILLTHLKKPPKIVIPPVDLVNSVEFKMPDSVRHSRHPLTPNLAFSMSNPLLNIPRMGRLDTESREFSNHNVKRRSRSTESQMKVKKRKSDPEDILELILNYSNISECIPIFNEQEIDLKAFLTLDDEDLIMIGIEDETTRAKVLKAVQHYKRIFLV